MASMGAMEFPSGTVANSRWGAFRQMNANWNNISQLTGLPSALLYLPGVISGALMAMIAIVRIVDPEALKDPDTAAQGEPHL